MKDRLSRQERKVLEALELGPQWRLHRNDFDDKLVEHRCVDRELATLTDHTSKGTRLEITERGLNALRGDTWRPSSRSIPS